MPKDAATFFQSHCAGDRSGDALFLPHWSAADWARLLEHAQPVALAGGEVLIKRGDNGRALFLVASGALEVTAAAGRGESLGRLVRERPGSMLGEISFFDGRPRTATVWATEPTTLLRLDPEAVRAFAAGHPALGCDLLFALGRVLAFRMRHREAPTAALAC